MLSLSTPSLVLFHKQERPHHLRRILLIGLALLALVYAGMVGYYMCAEPSFVFRPRRFSQVNASVLPNSTQPVTFASENGVTLSGGIMKPQPDTAHKFAPLLAASRRQPRQRKQSCGFRGVPLWVQPSFLSSSARKRRISFQSGVRISLVAIPALYHIAGG